LLKSTERVIYSYDFVVAARAAHATPPSMLQIADAIRGMVSTKGCTHDREKGAVVYRVGDVVIDAQHQVAKILIRRGDKNAANAAYSHMKTGALDIKKKSAEQGGDKAAHLVISLKQETGKPHVYLAHLEGVPGISHVFVQALLNAALKDVAKGDPQRFTYLDPAGAKVRGGALKHHSFIPHLELQGHPSDAFKYDLENGVMQEIILVQHLAKQSFAGNQFLIEEERFVRLKPDKNLPQHNRLQSLIGTFRNKDLDYNEARLKFKDPNGVSRSVTLDIDTGTPAQGAYLKFYPIRSISPPMDESSDTLQSFITSEMVKRLIKDRK
jgi:hypothetical protein